MLNPMLGKKNSEGGGKIFRAFPIFYILRSQKRKAYCKFRKCTYKYTYSCIFFRDQVVLFIRD